MAQTTGINPQKTPAPGARRRSVKILLWTLAVVMVLIAIWQNWGDVETHFLFFTVRMPRLVYTGLAIMVGFILGVTAAPAFRGKARG